MGFVTQAVNILFVAYIYEKFSILKSYLVFIIDN